MEFYWLSEGALCIRGATAPWPDIQYSINRRLGKDGTYGHELLHLLALHAGGELALLGLVEAVSVSLVSGPEEIITIGIGIDHWAEPMAAHTRPLCVMMKMKEENVKMGEFLDDE